MKLGSGRLFAGKAQARQWVWDALQQQGLARPPLPPHQRIPNFVGARRAAERLFCETPWQNVRAIKVNPDSPQRHVRQAALARGIRVYVPTPRLQGAFRLLDPERIPERFHAEAAERATMDHWARAVSLQDMPPLDGIVTGCVAVTPTGKRAGKGAGYSDLEYAILRELGGAEIPVATTVHDAQVVDDFPVESNDQPVWLICTPTRTFHVGVPPAAPERVEWERLRPEDIDAMPVLRELQDLQRGVRS
jgi:5-formyltetrahydrofolate cyclo-ligase